MTQHYPIYFKAIIWDTDTAKAYTEEGFVCLPNLNDALVYISDYFGKELITLKVHPLQEGPILMSEMDTYRTESDI